MERGGKSDLHDIAVELKVETSKAWLVFDGSRDAWIPKSQAELEKIRDKNLWMLTAPEWLLQDKGLI